MARNTTGASAGTRRRRGALSASVTAAGVLAASIVQESLLTGLFLLDASGAGNNGVIGFVLSQTVERSLAGALPLAVGVFLSLWLAAPLGAGLRLGHVITRSVLAAGIGAVLAAIVGVILAVVTASLPLLSGMSSAGWLADVASGSIGALLAALTILISLLPIVVLAGVLLWLRLREKDRAYDVEGMIDL